MGRGNLGATVVLASGNECCADGTRGPSGSGASAACCGGTVRQPTYKCCKDNTQALYCGADAWAGVWAGPVARGCDASYTSRLQYTITVVSETSIIIDYVYGAGNGESWATISGNSGLTTDGIVQLTLNPTATPPNNYMDAKAACMHGTLTRQ